jgi:membrane protein implicated in regulation of membrane protease activity
LNSLFLSEPSRSVPEPIYGTVDKAIVQGRLWRVKFNGSFWSARLYHPERLTALEPGDAVEVLAIQGITLLVAPCQR